MAPPSKVDDPANIASFLQKMRFAHPTNVSPAAEVDPNMVLNPATPVFAPQGLARDAENVPFNASSQQIGEWPQTPAWQQPSQFPFPRAPASGNAYSGGLVKDENGFITEASEISGPTFENGTLTPLNTNIKRPKELTPTQHRLLIGKKPGVENLTQDKLSELSRKTQGYMDSIVNNFRRSHQADVKQAFKSASPAFDQDVQAKFSNGPEKLTFPEFDDTPVNAATKADWKEEEPAVVPFNTPEADTNNRTVAPHDTMNPSPAFDEPALPDRHITRLTTPVAKPFIEEKPASRVVVAMVDQSAVRGQRATFEDHGHDSKTTEVGSDTEDTQSPTLVVGDFEVKAGTQEDEQEDRENMTRFSSWGTPMARNKPKSRQRTIVLTGLPRTVDLKLVQSYIHGGAVESMNIVPGAVDMTNVSAYVTFTSADACDNYYNKYPNGLDVKISGKKWSVLVHKREGVDVVSGMLQGYLECGATRVVKVSNADDDWGIVALNKLAEGKNGARKVEAVLDAYHNGTRAITFRFAKIADAVQFKGILIRSDEWEGSHVEFDPDPCAKATGFRTD